MSHQDVADIQALAEKMRDDAVFEESKRFLRVRTMTSGRLLAECASCPKNVRDVRKYGVWAFYTSTTVPEFRDAVTWFAAHRATDLHRWYADQDSPAPFEYVCSTAKRKKRKQAVRKERERAARPSPMEELTSDLARLAEQARRNIRPTKEEA